MKEIFLHANQLAVGYQKKALIQDITVSVRSGEILTLIGPNGAGKSTILKSMIGQLRPIAGTICLKNQSVSQMRQSQIAQTMSILMTNRIETEWMRCADVVESGRYPYTGTLGVLSDYDHKKVEEAMQLVHVQDLADQDFNCISDGQRQRVMLAKAICQEPDILILDEPTSFLDIRHKLELLKILKNLVKEKQIAVILSLHELDLAQKISDFVMCIYDQRVDRYGTPDEIFKNGYIQKVYGITCGSYNDLYGSLELAAPEGDPEVFVIGGGGSGNIAYRRLQRKGIPFAAGILHENDLDYPVAKALAVQIVTEKAFEPISDDTLHQALQLMQQCNQVICCLKQFGSGNNKNKVLLQTAIKTGKIIYDTSY